MLNNFRVKFSEFSKIGDEVILNFIEEAKLQINPKIWGRYYEVGVIYLTAHLITMQGLLNDSTTNNPTPIQEVSSKSVGALSISYTSNKTGFENESGDYFLTKYGKRFLELKKIVKPHFGVLK